MTALIDRTYVLINAHCGHVALTRKSRRTVQVAHSKAHELGLFSWRVRVARPDAEGGSCDVCKADLKKLKQILGASRIRRQKKGAA